MKKICSRRMFFKAGIATLAAVTSLKKMPGLIGNVLAASLPDSAINKQNYLHDILKSKPTDPAALKKYEIHVKKVGELGGKDPMCLNCTHFRPLENGEYGKCAMVGAKDSKPGERVYKNGWCKIYTPNKKILKG